LAEATPDRTLASVLLLLGDIRLAVLSASTVLLTMRQATWSVVVLVGLALPLVWILRRPRRWLDESLSLSWVFTLLDVSLSVLVLAVSGVDSFVLIYLAVTVAVAGLRLGIPGVTVATLGTIAVHLWAYLSITEQGRDYQLTVVLAVRLGLIGAVGYATARLREVLLTRGYLVVEVQRLQEQRIRDGERQRLARDLHDSLAKTLHGAVLLGSRLQRRLSNDGDRRDADVVLQALVQAQTEARQILGNLRAAPVDDLRAAVIDLATQWQIRTAVTVNTSMPASEPDLPETSRAEILFALGELLENVDRHASASEVCIEMSSVAEVVSVSVTDNGIGMPVPDLECLGRQGHYGLVGVRERMVRLGGTVAIRPSPSLSVVLTVPREPVDLPPTVESASRGVIPLSTAAGRGRR
jgi:signal transduction histidine kinase